MLLLAQTDAPLDGDGLPVGLHSVALVVLTEQVRVDAADTIAYFLKQGVVPKVISGDSPHTVGAVAARVGMPDADRPADARDLPDDLDALGQNLEERAVFGRVTPHQKQSVEATRYRFLLQHPPRIQRDASIHRHARTERLAVST